MNVFITDLDGTLLDTNVDVGEQNQQALRELVAQGYEIVLASGRNYLDTTSLSLSGITPYRILLNGSQIYDKTGTLLYDKALPYEEVVPLLSYCEENDLIFVLYLRETRYVSLPKNIMRHLYDIAKTHGEDEETIVQGLQIMYDMYANYPRYDEEIKQRMKQGVECIYKIEVTHANVDVLQALEAHVSDELSVSSSWPTNREITAKGVNKATALEILCTHLSATLENCIAIGDSRNDMEILQRVGFSIAMGNASQDIIDVCDYVTGQCSDSGVAQAIHHILTNKE